MQGEEGSYIRVVETVRSRAHKSQRGGRELFGIFDDPGKEKERERDSSLLLRVFLFRLERGEREREPAQWGRAWSGRFIVGVAVVVPRKVRASFVILTCVNRVAYTVVRRFFSGGAAARDL